MEKHICDYGCGQEATFQLKCGKWCCSQFVAKCPEMRRKNSACWVLAWAVSGRLRPPQLPLAADTAAQGDLRTPPYNALTAPDIADRLPRSGGV